MFLGTENIIVTVPEPETQGEGYLWHSQSIIKNREKTMAEEFLTLMADLDDESQHIPTFMGRITKLHLCAFGPTREVA